jgi:hypothetical protein
MKNPNAKLALGLALLATGLVLMCIGIRWLFFVGLALSAVSGTASLRPRKRVAGPGRLVSWFLWIGSVVLVLWLFSFGREPLPWSLAAVAMLAAAVPELHYRRVNRKDTHEA